MEESPRSGPVTLALARQHLIDPEICIRCNTCEETCPTGAIKHDRRNYAVVHELCNECGDCLPPCPTGAIDSWRRVVHPHPVESQLAWDTLPEDQAPAEAEGAAAIPPEVVRIRETASESEGGRVPPPWSAAHPYVGLYSMEHPAIATVVGTYRLTAEDADSDIRHIVLDFGKTAFPVLEGQSIGVVPAGESGALVRLYSVASPRNGERPGHNNLSLTVKRVVTDHEGRPVRGLASNYLCDLRKGDQVKVTGPYGSSFLMPNHPGAKILMICTGTGAAPMRAMTERRRRRLGRNEGGEILLFFGARRPEELPYFGPLMKLPPDLIRVELAFSRVPGRPKEYVQDRMRLAHEAVARLLADDDSFIFICGHKRMEEGVRAAFTDIARDAGLAPWSEIEARFRRAGRLHVETY